MMAPQIARLTSRHAALEAEIDQEQSRPAPDALRLRRLKRDKLRIKDSLADDTRRAAQTG
jgi:hypothetical protein